MDQDDEEDDDATKDLPTAEDLEKRQDLSLRMAVKLQDNKLWRRFFTIFICSLYLAAFLYKSCKCENCSIIQMMKKELILELSCYLQLHKKIIL